MEGTESRESCPSAWNARRWKSLYRNLRGQGRRGLDYASLRFPNLGKTLAEVHIDKAKNLMKEYFISLPDPDLAYLAQGTKEFKDYLNDLLWAQTYAMLNRKEMLQRVLEAGLHRYVFGDEWEGHYVKTDSLFRVNCHHNYTSMENHNGSNVWITRKGAVSAREGEWGIIPGSMGTRSLIVLGLGNEDSFCSCSHGAGRRMSLLRRASNLRLPILRLRRLASSVRRTMRCSMKFRVRTRTLMK